jgi:hypothetical protein
MLTTKNAKRIPTLRPTMSLVWDCMMSSACTAFSIQTPLESINGKPSSRQDFPQTNFPLGQFRVVVFLSKYFPE